MLEEEMRKSGEKQKTQFSDLSFLQDIAAPAVSSQDASTTTEQQPPATPRPAMFLSSQSLDDASSVSSRNELSMCVTPKRKISANYPLLSEAADAAAASACASGEDLALQKESKSSPQQKPKRDSERCSSQDRNVVSQ